MKGYYINLKHRIDRKKNIEDLKKKYPFFSNVKRMDAFCHKQGVLGCAMSHIKCLEELKKNSDDYYMILEDDFFINNENNFLAFLNDFDLIKHSNSWDVITMTPLGKTFKRNYINNFHKIVNTQTTTGIIIKHNFLDKLLEVFKKSKETLENVKVNNIISSSNFKINLINQIKKIQDTKNKKIKNKTSQKKINISNHKYLLRKNSNKNISTKKNSRGISLDNAIDMKWKSLQNRSNFIYYTKLFASQLKGYSDIENYICDYSKYYIKQGKSWRF